MFIVQVMSVLLEEWCVSSGHHSDLDVTSLSVALEQARLKYHAQAIRYRGLLHRNKNIHYYFYGAILFRNLSLEPGSAVTAKPPVMYTPTPTPSGSITKRKKLPPGTPKPTIPLDSGVNTGNSSSEYSLLLTAKKENQESSSPRNAGSKNNKNKQSVREMSRHNDFESTSPEIEELKELSLIHI